MSIERALQVVSHGEVSASTSLSIYFGEMAVTAALTTAIFAKVRPSLVAAAGMGLTGLAFSGGAEVAERVGGKAWQLDQDRLFGRTMWAVLGPQAGFQLAALGWVLGQCSRGAFTSLRFPAKIFVGSATAATALEFAVIKAFAVPSGLFENPGAAWVPGGYDSTL